MIVIDSDCASGECNLECGCTKELDEYCCWRNTFLNPCLAECADVSKPEDTYDKSTCDSSDECNCLYLIDTLK